MTTPLAGMRAELSSAMSRSAPGLPTANELCAACVRVLGVDGAAITMVFDGASQGTYGSSSEASRRLDEYQFTFGEGPCLDATASGAVVHAPDLDGVHERRWPLFVDAVVGDGVRAVFALPVMLALECVGALDLYRVRPGPLTGDQLSGAMLAAELATLPLLTLTRDMRHDNVGLGAKTDIGDNPDQARQLSEMDRVEVYQATGMLIAQLGVSAADALARLRAYALSTGRTASEIAYEILEQGLQLDRDDRANQEGPTP